MPKTSTSKAAPSPGAEDTEPDTPAQAAAEPDTAAPDPAPADDHPEPPAGAGEAPAEEEPEQLPPGVYEYAFGIGCVYPHVPLTCHAYHPAVEATETSPEVPEREATRFEWLDGPPMDGRWVKTCKKANQAADNAGGLPSSKE
ncbi:hypothetical protein [Streptomyces fagopyri]|uniref:hypothetical protein n=1 Tax=Streptomyces fagopyri TaxID=2662397 RepID=UPI00380964AC